MLLWSYFVARDYEVVCNRLFSSWNDVTVLSRVLLFVMLNTVLIMLLLFITGLILPIVWFVWFLYHYCC